MLAKRDYEKISFHGVGLFLIVLGAAIFAFGLVGWLFNMFGNSFSVAFPSLKVIGGAVVISLGYVILELELLRRK